MIDPMFIFITWLVIMPILAAIALLLPLHIGLLISLYLVYTPANGGLNPIYDMMTDLFGVMGAYHTLFNYWLDNRAALPLETFTLPLLVPAGIGASVGLFFFIWCIRYCINVFRVTD